MKELVKSYGFETVSDLANYIVESYVNGQKKQACRIYDEVYLAQGSYELGLELVQNHNHGIALEVLKHVGFGWYSRRPIFSNKRNYDRVLIENLFYDQGMDIPKV